MFGLLLGSRMALVVEASERLAELEGGKVFKHYKAALKTLVDEQLVTKNKVHLVKYGDSASPKNPQGLPFTKFKAE